MQKHKPLFSLGWGLAGLLILTFLGAMWLGSTPVNASADGIWTELPVQTQLSGVRRIVPDRYRLLQANTQRLKGQLAKAPLESPSGWEQAPTLDLPLPDGRWWTFTVVSAPIMEPGLAAKYPEITTYLARAVHDSSITARLDFTPQGFHGLIFDHSDSYFIDPYRVDDLEHYISYSRAEYMTLERRAQRGFVETPPVAMYDSPPSHTPGRYRSGETLRTYRLAVAATSQYTTHFGSKTNALAAIATTINRVVGVYEKEVAVRMVLVANNDEIVYTSEPDPYGNGDILADNQSNLDSTIGSPNYDIGHVFDLGDGGVAYLGVTCAPLYKARGMTGRDDPTGDPFDIDYVAHEMGHQFGALHTFNGTTFSCGGGNRDASAAYEPGSGSTIMAYAGICGAENLQPNSDPYFHYKSLEEITAFVATDGNSCASTNDFGNLPPSANAGADYTIPARTPFELTGSGSDPNGEALTYTWEEYDLGPASPPNTDGTGALRPIFRSFNPTTSPTRVFPQLQDILNNTSTLGEALPTVDRTMTFRLTVRDNNPSSGGFGTDTMSLVVENTGTPFEVTAPNTAVTWTGNTQETVMWNVAGTTAAPVSCASVNILLSTDGGQTYPISLASGTANDGSETLTVPNISASGTARIKVRCSTSVFFDLSNTNFTITPGSVVMHYLYTPTILK